MTGPNDDGDTEDDSIDQEQDLNSTPGLSASGSSAESTTSSDTPPPPTTTPRSPPFSPTERPLTRRQRKALGLPKIRAVPLTIASNRHPRNSSSGKIVIPGGRYKNVIGKVVRGEGDEDDNENEGDAEWERNGTGRVDVRGFRELKI